LQNCRNEADLYRKKYHEAQELLQNNTAQFMARIQQLENFETGAGNGGYEIITSKRTQKVVTSNNMSNSYFNPEEREENYHN
jgi:hypothetical protein